MITVAAANVNENHPEVESLRAVLEIRESDLRPSNSGETYDAVQNRWLGSPKEGDFAAASAEWGDSGACLIGGPHQWPHLRPVSAAAAASRPGMLRCCGGGWWARG